MYYSSTISFDFHLKMQTLQFFFDWSEVWALLIPLAVLLYYKTSCYLLRPVVLYICLALILNFSQDFIREFGIKLSFTSIPGNNSFIYNTNSIIRLLLFSWFFIQLRQPLLALVQKIIPVFFVFFLVVNFSIYENYISFSSRTLACEALLLLMYCLIFYLNQIRQDQPFSYENPIFWIVTGLSIYFVIDFPIFLFYSTLSIKFKTFAIDIWYVHNIAFIILCCFFAKAFFMNQNHE